MNNFLNNYVVFDFETTGLSYNYHEIIEIGAVKIINGVKVNDFMEYVKPKKEIPEQITELTGITNSCIENARQIKEVLTDFLNFIGDSLLIAHNARGFDIDFLYANMLRCFGLHLKNNYIDTLDLSKIVNCSIENHKLTTIAKYYDIKQKEQHRAKADSETTQKCFVKMLELLKNYDISTLIHTPQEPILKTFNFFQTVRAKEVAATVDEIIIDYDFLDKTFVFTGELKKIDREKAYAKVISGGGRVVDNVSSKVDVLVNASGDMSGKMKKALELQAKGHHIKIINDDTFMQMLESVAAIEE